MTDNDITVYDTVNVHELEESGDNIAFLPPGSVVQELMLTSRVVKETDTVMVQGESYISGDKVTYFLNSDMEVDLWTI